MRRRIECWTAEQLLPLQEDGFLEPEVGAWLQAHRARCARHAPAASPFPSAPDCDAETLRLAVERIRRSFAAAPETTAAPSGWLGDLVLEFWAAPLPMTALAAVSLVVALSRARPWG